MKKFLALIPLPLPPPAIGILNFIRILIIIISSLLFLSLFSCGCSNLIIPPSNIKKPRPIAILDHGIHSSLMLENSPHSMVRYSYGDWKYYALQKTGPFETSSALFWPTQAGLGRKHLLHSLTMENIQEVVKIHIEKILVLYVDEEKITLLRKKLDRIFLDQADTLMANQTYDLEFVHHPRPYWIFHNSNQMVGEWLQDLGCLVEGNQVFSSLFSSWEIKK